MRLQRLDLIRYGHFTNKSVELPRADIDFHIVYGPNEAGKSTALSAIEDLLFGIPLQSPYNFLHDYSTMRIGAVLENSSTRLDVVRKKGNKGTLLDTDESPIAGGDGALASFLAGADRPFFERMFSLDHARLHAGGQDILQAKDDIGQMLFSAGTGIGGLRDRLNALIKEADDLWAPRRAERRKFYQADDRRKQAESDLREHTLSTSRWQDLKRAYEASKKAHATVTEAYRKATAERNRLSRIRRVYRDIQRKRELDVAIAILVGTVTLPEDARETLEACERKEAGATARIETLSARSEQASEELADLTFDETLHRRAEDIRQLHERRIEIRGARADLPKREAELNAAEKELRDLALELGWNDAEIETLIGRIPTRTRISVVRSLLGERGELASNLSNKAQALEHTREDFTEAQMRFDEVGDTVDVSSLAAVVRAIRERGDITGRLRISGKDATDTQTRVDRLLASLHPSAPGEKETAEMQTPARARVQGHRDLVQDWHRSVRETQQQIKSLERELTDARNQLEKVVRDEHGVSAGQLEEVRGHRNSLWQLIKLKHIHDEPIPDEERVTYADELDDLASAFEPAMNDADALADRRFANAEAAGRLAGMVDAITKLEARLEQTRENEQSLDHEGENLASDWQTLWECAPFEPADPDAMIEWLDQRDAFLEAIEAREEARSELEGLREEEREAKEQVLIAMASLGVDRVTLGNDALVVVLEKAADKQRRHEAQSEKKAQLQDSLRDAKADVEARQRELDRTESVWSAWEGKWADALGELGLAANLEPAAVEAQIDVIDQLRERGGQINTLRNDRIDKINRDITDFENVVDQLVQSVATDLIDTAADEAVLELEARLDEAERLSGLQKSKKQAADELTKDIEQLEEERLQAATSVEHLKEAAGVESNAELKTAIAKSDELRGLQDVLVELTEKLEHDGDGLSLDALAEECADIDIDQTAALEESIGAELLDIQEQLSAAVEERTQARQAFQVFGGDDAAATAAADRQEALAEMKEVAEHYVRVRTSALLLQWSIDRYRREKQAPLLKQARELFATLSGGSFTNLRVVFDDQENAQLTGVRSNGVAVPVSGMSTGTADQLYLALRVASIEDYQERADALPFVADDLFINFDDDRAAAGFQVLANLAQKSQVLFFTHHQHLVNIARSALGPSLHFINLADAGDEVAGEILSHDDERI